MNAVIPVRIPDDVKVLSPFVDAGVLGAAEVHLAAWVRRAADVDDPLVVLATAMAAWAAHHGHVCAALPGLASAVAREHSTRVDDTETETASLPWPDPAAWLDALKAAPSSVVRVVDDWDVEAVFDACPLVLHHERVYLQRHWIDECLVAAALRQRAVTVDVPLSAAAAAVLEQLLPAEFDGEPNLQRLAAEAVLGNRLALVVGGPGTGKTYSVARLLAVLLEQAREEGRSLRVALAAPTGKAAARLQESIAVALTDPGLMAHVSAEARQLIGSVAPSTIHRLLGPLGTQRQRFEHDASRPLPHDVVVIDETSMVSLPLLARLCESVRPEARLVLIGDPDQLESVELGAVLGDLVGAAAGGTGPLAGRVVRLVRGHRFGGGSPIAQLADAVRRGDADAAVEWVRRGAPSVRFVKTLNPLDATVVSEVAAVVKPALTTVRSAAEAGQDEAALVASSQLRMLCAHRQGPFGVSAWNHLGERWMCGPSGAGSAWYPGRPLLATRNDPRLGLANGDTGVVIRDGARLLAVFRTALGLQHFDPVQLDEIETAYAMTVHKSQGSEYPTVVMVLPPLTSPLIGRELVYTGVTRAKETLVVVGDELALRLAVETPAHRMTGLTAALSGP